MDTGGSYDRVARRYAAELSHELAGKPLDRGLLDAFAAATGSGPLADLGCGPGHVAAYLHARGATPVGLDLSRAMCREGRVATGLPFAAADMTRLPLGPSSLAGLLCFYALIHLGRSGRAEAYREFVRVLRPGGHGLLAFHTSDADVATGGSRSMREFLGEEVDLTFHFLDPVAEQEALVEAGLDVFARLDRQPYPAGEHPSARTYLWVSRPAG